MLCGGFFRLKVLCLEVREWLALALKLAVAMDSSS
jgi:hypothetical protein